MKLLRCLLLLLLIAALVLESDAWRRRRRRRRRAVGCSTAPSLAYTYRSGCSSPYAHGERCYYRCYSGYTQVSGSTTRTCSNGRWTGYNLVCRASTCSTPPTLAYTTRTGCSYPYTNWESCFYRCNSGYTQVSGSTVRTCSNGGWTGYNLVCRRDLGCSSPPTVVNTFRSGCYSPYTNGERCYYRCRPGYTPVSGGTVKTCSNGRWTGTNLDCRRGSGLRCPAPPTLANTYVTGCSYPYTHGERCYYHCRSGYGSTTKMCYYGYWSGITLVCS
ncbi:PREDICTED: sushi, von Willebrand factor type A, EGF and pentraxin domain-containing protein 1-like isoform X2 [Branchiostoma belcheri]|uniref:Sushi, von Willebrand factor type A, EGF and pentraxin domain-containing protein 1-like isoform X1 n=1 Tax=Branchiostoma belcheri TaxID=7741 RepID=A0A6P4XJG1_BRABE|nr:PREDICTED: sushi, von Willebrand factor type A, EGF and pentraxin domain-containing protein 1-like isoform X1 [Branchiostoma belcheri]XP_019616670.1 PREDICTED: sushi, von Willebrand factor type A, EGF and pentraxin domain-containing protein 1-like isoform X2 [Branchiostoma belcheri]